MNRANFIVGFNNWGKTTIINLLFGRNRYETDRTYLLNELNIQTRFAVHSQSNDDIQRPRFLQQIERKLENTATENRDLFATLCPSLENGNNSVEILQSPVFDEFEEINLLILQYKWDNHAELIIENIEDSMREIPRINFYAINAGMDLPVEQRNEAKINQIRDFLQSIYN